MLLTAVALAYFNLPIGQSLNGQVQAWSHQARIDLTYVSTDSMKARQAVKGWYEPREALCRVLQGSGLTFTVTHSQSVVMRQMTPHVHPNLEESCGEAPPMRADRPIRIDTWPVSMPLTEGLSIIRAMVPSGAYSGGSLNFEYDHGKDGLTKLAAVRPGDYTLEEALCGLLKGTGLRLEWVDSHTVLVAREQAEGWRCACTTDPLNTPPCIQVPIADWKR